MRGNLQDIIEARGAHAFLEGAPRSANPFQEGTDQHFLWDVGWLENDHSEAYHAQARRMGS